MTEVDEDFNENYGARGKDVRKFSKQFTASESGITEYDEDLKELKSIKATKKRGKKLSITPSVAAIVEDSLAEEEEEAEGNDTFGEPQNATQSMATAAEQLLRNELRSDDHDKLASLLGK